MGADIFFVAIDVDDKSFHGSVYQKESGIVREFRIRPTVGHLVKELAKISGEVRVCYEATYIGYSLQRSLAAKGYTCDVIAPSLIPMQKGRSQKTDKLDSRKLAEYYGNDQLTKVHIPDEAEEVVRDMIRSRNFVMNHIKRIKLHIQSQCRRCGLDYKGETGGVQYWTQKHRGWLKGKLVSQDEVLRINFDFLLGLLQQQEEMLVTYDAKITELSKTDFYKRKVEALCCYRGLSILTSMTLVSELGDIKRFVHPRKLASYAGMDIVEYSSGGKERRYGISKMGNRHIRRVVIEACQQTRSRPELSRRLKISRQGVDRRFVDIADRCMHRLYRKSQRLLQRDKSPNKVKVACGREMLCFIWESLQAVAS